MSAIDFLKHNFFLNYSRNWWWENSWGQVGCLVVFGSSLVRYWARFYGGAGLAECWQRLDLREGYWDWLYDRTRIYCCNKNEEAQFSVWGIVIPSPR